MEDYVHKFIGKREEGEFLDDEGQLDRIYYGDVTQKDMIKK